MSVLLIRRRRPLGEPAVAGDAISTIEGTAGAGRIAQAMAELGLELGDVEQAVVEPDATAQVLDGITLATRFDVVALGSHLVNLPDDDIRDAFLRLASRHTDRNGVLIVEHHPTDWAETAADVGPTPGAAPGMEGVRRHPPFVSAVSVFDIGGRVERQPFTARVLSEQELAGAVASVHFVVSRRLAPTFLEARHGDWARM